MLTHTLVYQLQPRTTPTNTILPETELATSNPTPVLTAPVGSRFANGPETGTILFEDEFSIHFVFNLFTGIPLLILGRIDT